MNPKSKISNDGQVVDEVDGVPVIRYDENPKDAQRVHTSVYIAGSCAHGQVETHLSPEYYADEGAYGTREYR